MPIEPGPLNSETLESLKEYADPGDPGFLRDIVTSYLTDAESRLGAARQAHKAGDIPALGRIFHTIRGSSLNVGAEVMASLMHALENECKKGILPPAGRLTEAELGLLRAKEAFSAWLG